MYPPPHHQSENTEKMIALIREFPLGILITAANSEPFITHIPFIYNSKTGKLVAHIDRSNPQLSTLVDGAAVTVIFKGPDTYISPSIYTTKQLPTWNYIIAHISGTIKLINEADKAKQTMIDMTAFLEGDEPKYKLHPDNKAMDRLIDYIQAFEITITNWEGKFKLSQDKNKEDHLNAKNRLIKNNRKDLERFIELIYT